MTRSNYLLIVFCISANAFLFAQHDSHYISEKDNEIKALSNNEINQLLNGEGMGMAKAAELNSYPGPKHVLEFSKELNLSSEDLTEIENIIDKMKTEAVRLGRLIVQKENELDKMFRTNNIKDEEVNEKVQEIAKLRGELRYTHLYAHIQQKQLLTSEQIKIYNQLRGY